MISGSIMRADSRTARRAQCSAIAEDTGAWAQAITFSLLPNSSFVVRMLRWKRLDSKDQRVERIGDISLAQMRGRAPAISGKTDTPDRRVQFTEGTFEERTKALDWTAPDMRMAGDVVDV